MILWLFAPPLACIKSDSTEQVGFGVGESGPHYRRNTTGGLLPEVYYRERPEKTRAPCDIRLQGIASHITVILNATALYLFSHKGPYCVTCMWGGRT